MLPRALVRFLGQYNEHGICWGGGHDEEEDSLFVKEPLVAIWEQSTLLNRSLLGKRLLVLMVFFI